ncbi:hypothetical protein FRC19_006056 [Serendipita sp. 401]|nr:hypothetical protein FRC19_006056 [Serendipita sp. 401]
MRVKIVFFDALHTIVKPRLPIFQQYAEEFSPYFSVEPQRIKTAFKDALKQVQVERPAYSGQTTSIHGNNVESWWGDVIRRTAIGAGADRAIVEESLPQIVPRLLHRFSSKEGYVLFDDTLPTIEALSQRGIQTGLVSNTDKRMRLVLEDLGVLSMLSPALFSSEEGVEKPSSEIWHRALQRAEVQAPDALHVGDELDADFYGAREAGLHSLLLQRPESEPSDNEMATNYTITSLMGLFDFLK